MTSRRDRSLEKFSRSPRNKGTGNRKGFYSAAEIKVLPSTCCFCDNNGSGPVKTLADSRTICYPCFQQIILERVVMEAITGEYL